MSSICCDKGREYIDSTLEDSETINHWGPIFHLRRLYTKATVCYISECEMIHEKLRILIDSEIVEKKNMLMNNYLAAKMELILIYAKKLGVPQYEIELEQTARLIVKQKLLRTMSENHPSNEFPLFEE